jgi:drug/metabolite transporter (DMT)-like permease
MFLSRALALGQAALIAPLLATYGAVAAVLSLLDGETLSRAGYIGLFCCTIGAPLAALAQPNAVASVASSAAIRSALISALANGFGFWLEGRYALPRLGALPALWVVYGIGTATAGAAIVLRRGDGGARFTHAIWPLLVAAAALSLGAYAAFAVGTATGQVAVVTASSTLACAVTVLLGVAIRKERLSARQWLGGIAVMVGVALLRRA